MTLAQIQEQVMFQTNNDADDLGDFLPALTDYINEGYDRMVKIWSKSHTGTGDYDPLEDDEDEPLTPEWTHRFLADWATWLIYRNGNPQKQQRGLYYRSSFEEMLAMLADEGGADGLNEDGSNKKYRFINIPV